MRAGQTSIIINNQNLADANITGSEERITNSKDMTFKSRIGNGVSNIDLTLAVRFRNSFKGNNPSSALNAFFSYLEERFNNWNVGFDDILWWVVKKNFSYIELSQYSNPSDYLGNSIFGNIFGGASTSITNIWSGLNNQTSGLLNAGLGMLNIGGNNYNEAGLTTFWDSASDSVGVMANSKYLQLDSSLPIFDVTQETYGVPIPFAASSENKISQDTRNTMYELSIKTTALMRRNLLGVAYGNMQIRGNMASDATVPHAVNLINDLPTLVRINQALGTLTGALGAAIPNFKLFGFVKYLSNIGNLTGFNLRCNRPITSSDNDFVVITSEERAQNAGNQVENLAKVAELNAKIQAAAQTVPPGGRLYSTNSVDQGYSVNAQLVPFPDSSDDITEEEQLLDGGVDENLPGVDEDLPSIGGEDGGTEPLPELLPITGDDVGDALGPDDLTLPSFGESASVDVKGTKGTILLTIGSNDKNWKTGEELYNLNDWTTYNNTKNTINTLVGQGYKVAVVLPPKTSTWSNGTNGIYEQVKLAADSFASTTGGYSVSIPNYQFENSGKDPHPTGNGYKSILTQVKSKGGITAVVGDSVAVGVAITAGMPTAKVKSSIYTDTAYTNGQATAVNGVNSLKISTTQVFNLINAKSGTSPAAAAVSSGAAVVQSSASTTPIGTATAPQGSTSAGTGSVQTGTTSSGRTITAVGQAAKRTDTTSAVSYNKDGNDGNFKNEQNYNPQTATGIPNDGRILGITVPLGPQNTQNIKINTAAIVTVQSGSREWSVLTTVNDTGGFTYVKGGERFWGELGTNTIEALATQGAPIRYTSPSITTPRAGALPGKSGASVDGIIKYEFLESSINNESEYNSLYNALVSEGRIGPNVYVPPTTPSSSADSSSLNAGNASASSEITENTANDGTTTVTDDSSDKTAVSDNTETTTALQNAISEVSGLANEAYQKNYSNQQKAAFVSFSMNIGNKFYEVDYFLKRIVKTSIRACKTINQRLSNSASGNYNVQFDAPSTPGDLNSSLSSILGIPADSPLISIGGPLISGIFTGQNATTTLLNAGQQALGNLESSLSQGAFGQITQQADGAISLLNGAGQLVGAGNLLPSTGELLNALNPTQFLSTLNMPSILPNLSLGSLGDLLGIAASIGQNGPPTSISGLIQLQEQIYTIVCNFEIPIIEDLITWKENWEEFFNGFEWKDIEKKLKDVVRQYVEQILDRFNIVKIIRDIINDLDQAVDNFLNDLWKRFTDCSRYQTEDRSGREGSQSSSWLSKQPPGP